MVSKRSEKACICSTLSHGSFPNVALETAPLLVGLTMALSLPFKTDCWAASAFHCLQISTSWQKAYSSCMPTAVRAHLDMKRIKSSLRITNYKSILPPTPAHPPPWLWSPCLCLRCAIGWWTDFQSTGRSSWSVPWSFVVMSKGWCLVLRGLIWQNPLFVFFITLVYCFCNGSFWKSIKWFMNYCL